MSSLVYFEEGMKFEFALPCDLVVFCRAGWQRERCSLCCGELGVQGSDVSA